MNEPTDADRRTAEELLSREYGKDHPAARHNFTLTFVTTTHAHRVSELARALAAERARARAEAIKELREKLLAPYFVHSLEGKTAEWLTEELRAVFEAYR